MRVKVRPMRAAGKNLPRQLAFKLPAYEGELSVREHRDHTLSRPVLQARLTTLADGAVADVLPELYDVQLLFMRDNELRLAGLERLREADVAQTWVVEVL